MMRRYKALFLLACVCLQGCPQDRTECAADTDCFERERCDSSNQCAPAPEVEPLACDLSPCQSELTQEVGCFAGLCEVRSCKDGAVRCAQGCCPVTAPTPKLNDIPFSNEQLRFSQRVYDAQGEPHIWLYDAESADLNEVSWDGIQWRSRVVSVYPYMEAASPSIDAAFEVTYDAAGTRHLAYTAINGALYYATIDAQGAWASEKLIDAPGGEEHHVPNQIVVDQGVVVVSFLTGTIDQLANLVLNPAKPALRLMYYDPITRVWTTDKVPTHPEKAVNKETSMVYTPQGIYIAVAQIQGADLLLTVFKQPLYMNQGWRELINREGYINHQGALTLKGQSVSLLYAELSGLDRYQLKTLSAPIVAPFAPEPNWSETTLMTEIPDKYLLKMSLELPDDGSKTEAIATLYNGDTIDHEIIALSQPPQDFMARRVVRDKLRCSAQLGYFNQQLYMLSCDESSFTYLTQDLVAP